MFALKEGDSRLEKKKISVVIIAKNRYNNNQI
jgi:hypothetical protein